MYYLANLFPAVRRIRIPFTRDQMMLLMAALNEILLGLETLLAHLTSGTITSREWIPIIFGPVSGVLLLLAGSLALRRRTLATVLATGVFLASILVGLLGAYFHIAFAIWPFAAPGEQVSVSLLIWAPPILGPLTFALVGLLGISSAWMEDPPDSGILLLPGRRRLRLPYNKTRAYFFIVGMGALATVISSVLDHARTNFSNPWLWLPTSIGVFGTVVAVVLGATNKPSRSDLFTYFGAMVLMILVGMLGSGLHILQNLTAQGQVVDERFLRGAPVLAPLLFSDIGMIGLLVLLNPKEQIALPEERGAMEMAPNQ
ncbi:MAG: hypothetical protein P8Z00_05120 [Anaerolineales bacterium]|jgi:hypothetical protein